MGLTGRYPDFVGRASFGRREIVRLSLQLRKKKKRRRSRKLGLDDSILIDD